MFSKINKDNEDYVRKQINISYVCSNFKSFSHILSLKCLVFPAASDYVILS